MQPKGAIGLTDQARMTEFLAEYLVLSFLFENPADSSRWQCSGSLLSIAFYEHNIIRGVISLHSYDFLSTLSFRSISPCPFKAYLTWKPPPSNFVMKIMEMNGLCYSIGCDDETLYSPKSDRYIFKKWVSDFYFATVPHLQSLNLVVNIFIASLSTYQNSLVHSDIMKSLC